jgi:predicted dehydrogenase
MLDETRPDFVDIATRPSSHFELIRTAAQQGIAVLCQKPLAASLLEAREMVETCRKHSVPFMVNENWRFRPWFRCIKRLLDQGEVGAPYFARFIRRNLRTLPQPRFENQPYFIEMERFIIYESCIHYIDTFRFLLGEIESIYCQTKKIGPSQAGEDLTVLMLNFAPNQSGQSPLGLVDANWCSQPDWQYSLADDFRLEAKDATVITKGDGVVHLLRNDGEKSSQVTVDPAAGYKESFRATQAHFACSLLEKSDFETSAQDNLKTLAAVFAAYESAEKKQLITL